MDEVVCEVLGSKGASIAPGKRQKRTKHGRKVYYLNSDTIYVNQTAL